MLISEHEGKVGREMRDSLLHQALGISFEEFRLNISAIVMSQVGGLPNKTKLFFPSPILPKNAKYLIS